MFAGPKEAILDNKVHCAARFSSAVKGLLARIQTYRQSWLAEVQAQCDERLKTLDAQADELTVSAGQLWSCTALGRQALGSSSHGRAVGLQRAAESAKTARGLVTASVRLRADTRMEMVCDLQGVPTALEAASRLKMFAVDLGRCSASGPGAVSFVKGGIAYNRFRVVCRDSGGVAADWVTAADVSVVVRGGNAVGRVMGAVVTEPGAVDFTYVVDDDALEEVEFSARVCGEMLPCGPWRARRGCAAEGRLVLAVPLATSQYNQGLAVTADETFMVVCNTLTNQLSVFRTEDGSHVRSFGCYGDAAGQFAHPHGLCMTGHDTVLVAEFGNYRVQEVTLAGTHVRFIGVGVITASVSCVSSHGDLVAVGIYGIPSLYGIMVFRYASGALVRQFGENGTDVGQYWSVRDVKFSHDGTHLLISDLTARVFLTTSTGDFVRRIGAEVLSRSFNAMAFTGTDDVVVANRDKVSVFSATDGALLRTWSSLFHLSNLTALTVSRNRLYMLHDGRPRVQVFV